MLSLMNGQPRSNLPRQASWIVAMVACSPGLSVCQLQQAPLNGMLCLVAMHLPVA